MGWTKDQLIRKAYSKLGMGAAFNIDSDEVAEALSTLDSMMATWNGNGIRLGYSLPSSPDDSDPSDDSGLPDTANEAVYLNLAIRLAPDIGKAMAPDAKLAAMQCYNQLLRAAAFPQAQFVRRLPAGAGNKPIRSGRTFLPESAEPLLAGDDGPITV